jgi:hypothetical protein
MKDEDDKVSRGSDPTKYPDGSYRGMFDDAMREMGVDPTKTRGTGGTEDMDRRLADWEEERAEMELEGRESMAEELGEIRGSDREDLERLRDEGDYSPSDGY